MQARVEYLEDNNLGLNSLPLEAVDAISDLVNKLY